MLSRSWHRAMGMFFVLVALFTSGCIRIQVIDRTPSIAQPTPFTQVQPLDEHNLAVLAVDFDPPLEYEEIIASKSSGKGITLLVAIENTGSVAETDVVVEVELYKGKEDQPFLHKTSSVDGIVPGEIELVRFKDTEIPFSDRYRLKVHVVPVSGEGNVVDNVKSYDLLITQP